MYPIALVAQARFTYEGIEFAKGTMFDLALLNCKPDQLQNLLNQGLLALGKPIRKIKKNDQGQIFPCNLDPLERQDLHLTLKAIEDRITHLESLSSSAKNKNSSSPSKPNRPTPL